VKLFLAHESDIIAGHPNFLEITPALELDLSLLVRGGNVQYCATLAGITLEGIEVTGLSLGLNNICAPLQLGGLSQLFTSPPQIVNSGIAADATLSRVAIRLELGSPALTAFVDWGSFFQGGFLDRLHGSQWGVFIDQNIIVGIAVKRFADSLGNSDPTQFVLTSAPAGSWVYYIYGGQTVSFVSITFSGTVPNVSCGLYHVDIDVDVTAGVSFHVSPPPNELGMHTHIDWSLSTWQVLECELGAILGATLSEE